MLAPNRPPRQSVTMGFYETKILRTEPVDSQMLSDAGILPASIAAAVWGSRAWSLITAVVLVRIPLRDPNVALGHNL